MGWMTMAIEGEEERGMQAMGTYLASAPQLFSVFGNRSAEPRRIGFRVRSFVRSFLEEVPRGDARGGIDGSAYFACVEHIGQQPAFIL